MDELISRQAAIDLLKRWSGGYSYIEYDTESAIHEFERLPSAQPEIIRCKDCQHWGIHKRLNIPWCREMHIDRGAEDFCSYAERRTDGEEVH